MRRFMAGLALVAALVLATTPVLAADTYHYRSTGKGLFAYYGNVSWDAETLPPGEYFETYVYAASYVSTGDDGGYSYACVDHWAFTVDGLGGWTDWRSIGGCGPVSLLKLDGKLTTGRLVADIPIGECLAWDDEIGECLEWETIGSIAVDLTMTGTGKLYRTHGTSTGGAAGVYQYTSYGSGIQRAGLPAGTISLDGTSLTEGATYSGGWMFDQKSGGTEIIICHGDC
jgi:hypothetical protein